MPATAAERPLIAITQGDPAGVGPEVIAGIWSDPALHSTQRLVVVGHPEILRRAVALRGAAIEVCPVSSPTELQQDNLSSPTCLACLRAGSDDALAVPPATRDPRAGQSAYDALQRGVQLALRDEVDALVTAPLNKAALWQAGHHYPGHTELLAEWCGVRQFAMMLYLPPARWPGEAAAAEAAAETACAVRGPAGLGVVHVTLHEGLARAIAHLNADEIRQKIVLAADVFRGMRGSEPRIGVCALNPHAGEEGLFGDEESRIIAPAVHAARTAGLDVCGPLPADTLLARARDGEFDAVVAMYHDQGHIALKLLGMHRAVNVTLGLPIVRTSVAHGTAFDLAWQGRAETSGLREAIRVAGRLAAGRIRRS